LFSSITGPPARLTSYAFRVVTYRIAFEKEKVKRFTNAWKGFFTLSQRLYVLKQPR